MSRWVSSLIVGLWFLGCSGTGQDAVNMDYRNANQAECERRVSAMARQDKSMRADIVPEAKRHGDGWAARSSANNLCEPRKEAPRVEHKIGGAGGSSERGTTPE